MPVLSILFDKIMNIYSILNIVLKEIYPPVWVKIKSPATLNTYDPASYWVAIGMEKLCPLYVTGYKKRSLILNEASFFILSIN